MSLGQPQRAACNQISSPRVLLVVARPCALDVVAMSDDSNDADLALIAALERGDQMALTELYDRYAPLMNAIAVRLLDSRRDAEDLVHDVFIEAWQKIGSYDPGRGTVRAWLLLAVAQPSIRQASVPGDGQGQSRLADARRGNIAPIPFAWLSKRRRRICLHDWTRNHVTCWRWLISRG